MWGRFEGEKSELGMGNPRAPHPSYETLTGIDYFVPTCFDTVQHVPKGRIVAALGPL